MMSVQRWIVGGVLVFAGAGAGAVQAQTPDSAFAVSRSGQSLFRVNVDGGAVFGGAYDGGTNSGGIAAEGAGTRMMWYPQKASFRAGWINGTQWDDANIGYFSVAMGQAVRASGDNGTAFGLRSTAAGTSTFAAGEDNTASGAASVALGYHAHTNARQGSFVFGDRSTVDTIRAGVNHSANWRVSGGFRVFTSSNLSTGVTLQSGSSVSNWGQSNAVISTSTGAYLHTDGTWMNASDVNRKHNFLAVDGLDVLTRLRTLPVQSWSYRENAEGTRHMGPTAQDFHAIFGLGDDPVTISAVDIGGVAFASIKALDEQVARLQGENAALRTDVSALSAELAELRAELATLRSANARQEADRAATNQRLDAIEALLKRQAAAQPAGR
jgi:hypothetical protein